MASAGSPRRYVRPGWFTRDDRRIHPRDDRRQRHVLTAERHILPHRHVAGSEIVWDKVRPAHYCGMRYQDRFVPVFDQPTRGTWRDGGFRDDEFRDGMSWRDAYKSKG